MPVHDRDDIAGDNASLGRGAICLWLGDKGTLSSLEAQTLCDVGSDRLNLTMGCDTPETREPPGKPLGALSEFLSHYPSVTKSPPDIPQR
jgi:hypothetical protein